ncbi:MAG: putative lipid II flippase FtsW [Myxococcales bacterium]
MSKVTLTRSTSPAPRTEPDRARTRARTRTKPETDASVPNQRAAAARASENAGRPVVLELTLRERLMRIAQGKHWPKVTGGADPMLFGAVIALIVLGVVMVYSASSVRAVRVFGDGHHYLLRQAAYAAIGLPLLLVLARLDYHFYRPFAKPVLALAVGLLLMVIFGLGHNAGGASRWIQLGPVNVQPAEVTKLALILWLADSLAKKVDRIRSFSVGFLPHVLIAGFLVVLCMAQPDFGSSVILMLLTFVLLFTAGAKIGYMLAGAAVALPIAYLLVRSSEYRWQRIIAFTDPLKYRMSGGYQIVESWMSFGAGGVAGVGLGDSRQKMLFLPEAHTDFIAAIVAEELGFVGFCLLVTGFVVIVIRGARSALRSVDDYGTYLAIGLTMFIGIQAVTNLAVVLGLLPTKGLTLPFLSFGGSSLLVNCSAVGILLNISRPRQRAEAAEGAVAHGSATVPGSSQGSPLRERNRRTRESLGESGLTGGAR